MPAGRLHPHLRSDLWRLLRRLRPGMWRCLLRRLRAGMLRHVCAGVLRHVRAGLRLRPGLRPVRRRLLRYLLRAVRPVWIPLRAAHLGVSDILLGLLRLRVRGVLLERLPQRAARLLRPLRPVG